MNIPHSLKHDWVYSYFPGSHIKYGYPTHKERDWCVGLECPVSPAQEPEGYTVLEDLCDGCSILGVEEHPIMDPAFEVELLPGHIPPHVCDLLHGVGKRRHTFHLGKQSKSGNHTYYFYCIYVYTLSLTLNVL